MSHVGCAVLTPCHLHTPVLPLEIEREGSHEGDARHGTIDATSDAIRGGAVVKQLLTQAAASAGGTSRGVWRVAALTML